MKQDRLFNLKIASSAFVAHYFLTITCKLMRWYVKGEEIYNELKKEDTGLIITNWHSRMFLPIYYLRNQAIYGIVSPSRDGEYFAKLFTSFGWCTIRGSSAKEGEIALLKAVRILKKGNILAITPDGPTGPKEKVKLGIIYLSSKTNSKIISVGVDCTRKKILNTWDNTIIPLPFAKSAIVFSEPLSIPNKLTAQELKEYQIELERKINEANEEAKRLIYDINRC